MTGFVTNAFDSDCAMLAPRVGFPRKPGIHAARSPSGLLISSGLVIGYQKILLLRDPECIARLPLLHVIHTPVAPNDAGRFAHFKYLTRHPGFPGFEPIRLALCEG